ncbi:MAG: ATP-binding protein [Acetivibrio sp.]
MYVFVGRTQEITFLEEYYKRPGKQIIVVYGRQGIGKTELLRVFSKNKKYLYYNARECSEKEQIFSMRRDWEELYALEAQALSFGSLFTEAAKEYELLIIDEFNYIMKNSNSFMEGVLEALNQKKENSKLMVILCSSSVNWVENDMVGTMGKAAFHISAFQKIKELSFSDIVTRFPNYSVEDGIALYGILGGVPGYLNYWNDKRSIKDNIMALFLHKDGRFYREAENFLKTELRELALYNTILATLAQEKLKLNDIYDRTGFSRAKISVYIKNLIQLDVVEKVFSYDTLGRENTKKGLYRIKDRFLYFWYRFVFPNLSQLEYRKVEDVYREKIEKEFDTYLAKYFVSVCQEYISLMSDFGKLNFKVERMGQWFGKEGTIDFIGESNKKTYFVGKCKWDSTPMTEQDFEQLLNLIKQAEIEPDDYFLFSKSGFTSSLEVMANGIDNLVLTTLEDL